MEEIRASVQIAGIVQGVGFPPFVYGLARKHDLRGWVLNNEKVVMQFLHPLGYHGFEIRKSKYGEQLRICWKKDFVL